MIFGCATRESKPHLSSNSTIQYRSKKEQGISADIILTQRVSKKSGKPLFPSSLFPIKEKGILRAFISIENCYASNSNPLLFHIDWVDPNGSSLYRRQINLSPTDSSATISSSISINPEVRQPGEYKLNVYYFRELIAEKMFILLPESEYQKPIDEDIAAIITLCNKLDIVTNRPVDPDTIFSISKKGRIHAVIDLINRYAYYDEDLNFIIRWKGPNNKNIFTKRINLLPNDSTFTISSSIAVSPDARASGIYSVSVSLNKELLAERQFELKFDKSAIPKKPKVKANITLCSNVDKENGNPLGVNTTFTIAESNRVFALIGIERQDNNYQTDLPFTLVWTNPEGKQFFKKKILVSSSNLNSTLQSSITIEPDNRVAGSYLFQVYLLDELVGQKAFTLVDK
jgi:hypothetical protein